MEVVLKPRRKEKRSGGVRKYGRSARRVRWPLMPNGLTVGAAWRWYNEKYAHTRADGTAR